MIINKFINANKFNDNEIYDQAFDALIAHIQDFLDQYSKTESQARSTMDETESQARSIIDEIDNTEISSETLSTLPEELTQYNIDGSSYDSSDATEGSPIAIIDKDRIKFTSSDD